MTTPSDREDAPMTDLRDTLESLRQKAEAATPGPWEADGIQVVGTSFIGSHVTGHAVPAVLFTSQTAAHGAKRKQRIADAAYIAAAHPGVVLALLDVVEKTAPLLDVIARGSVWCGPEEDALRQSLNSLSVILGDAPQTEER